MTIAILVSGSLAALWWRSTHPGQPATTEPRPWIIVAEFEGPENEGETVRAVRSLVVTSFDESAVARVVPGSAIRLTLEASGRPANAPVTTALAREVAFRMNVRSVIEGEVRRIGSGYSITLRVVASDSSIAMLSESGTARTPDDLIPTVRSLTDKLSRKMGRAQGQLSFAYGVRLDRASKTRSFEAYVEMRRGGDAQDPEQKLAHTRRAVQIDPEFGEAWSALGVYYANYGMNDSALVAFQQAARLPGDKPASGEYVAARLAFLKGDMRGALRHAKAFLAAYPDSRGAYDFVALVQGELGQFDEQLRTYQAELKVGFYPEKSIILLGNLVAAHCFTGRPEEARRYASLMPDAGLRALQELYIEIASRNWPKADSVGRLLVNSASLDEYRRSLARVAHASVEIAQGDLSNGLSTLQAQTREVASTAQGSTRRAPRLAQAACLMAGLESPPEPIDEGPEGQLYQGIWDCLAGRYDRAKLALATARPTPSYWVGPEPSPRALLRGLIANHEGRWKDAVASVAPLARRPVENGEQTVGAVGLETLRWVTASAFEQGGMPDSAAAYLERALNESTSLGSSFEYPPLAYPFLHQRLAILYAKNGKLALAQQHYEALVKSCTRPDPTMRRLMADARAALAGTDASELSARPAAKPGGN